MDRYTAIFPALSESETAEHLQLLIENALQNKSGSADDTLIQKRIHEEWDAMEHHNMISAVAALYDLTMWLKSKLYPYRMKYAAGSSLILYLLGITSGNPLPHNLGGFDIPWQIQWGYGRFYTTLHMALPAAHYQEILEAIPIILNKQFLIENGYQTQINGQETKELHMSTVILRFELDENTVVPEFYEKDVTPSDYSDFLKNWERYLSIEFVQCFGLPKPVCMDDLITLQGLGASTGAVNKETILYVSNCNNSTSDMIVFRDDVYSYLFSHGFSEEDAYKGAERVGRGRGLPVITAEMEVAPDKWKIAQCQKVRYLPPKAGVVETLIYKHRLFALSEAKK